MTCQVRINKRCMLLSSSQLPEEMAAVERDDDDDGDDDDEEDDSHSISSFHLSGGFGEVSPNASASPAPSDLDALDSEVTVPFELPLQSD